MPRNFGAYVTVGSLISLLLIMNLVPIFPVNYEPRQFTLVDSDLKIDGGFPSYTPHAPITINGDNNFSETALAEGWDGDGSAESPYAIDGLEINRGGGIGHCINISNTRANFTIQFCNLTGATINPGSGIYLNNVSFGLLINNTINSNRIGITLLDAHFNTIANNSCTSNVHGIYMYDSDINTISDNDCSSNSNYGIFQNYCDTNIIRRNICNSNGVDGIRAEEADYNSFTENTCNGNNQDGINVLWHAERNILTNNTCNGNSHYGIIFDNDPSVYVYAIVSNNTCVGNDYGIQLSGPLINADNNILIDNLWCGFELFCSESTIMHNIVEGSEEGFFIPSMSYNTLSHNTIHVYSYGIWIEDADECSISHNTITGSDEVGILLDRGGRNSIFLNDIVVNLEGWDPLFWVGIYLSSNTGENNVTLNRIQRERDFNPDSETIRDHETGLSNIIDRNFYDDYEGSDNDDDGIGEDPYNIPGNAGNVDLHPLVFDPFAPKWVEPPTDQVLDYWSQPFYYDLNATAPSPITWQVNDTSQFSIDSNGVIQSIVDLPVDEYGLTIKVTNIYGVSISETFILTVQEITLPEWIVGPTDVVLDFGEAYDYGLIATDQSGIVLWTLNDTINFNLTVTQLNVSGYPNGWQLLHITNATTLSTGVYALNVSVSDPYGNLLIGIFSITIRPWQDTTAPVWIVEPVDETLEHTQSVTQRLGAWDESGIHHWWLNDSTYFAIDEDGVVRNVTMLEAGTYPLEVRAYDPFDNYCSAVFVITVVETTPTTTPSTSSTSTPTSPTELPQNGFDPLALFAIIGGAASAVIILILVILYRKKNQNT